MTTGARVNSSAALKFFVEINNVQEAFFSECSGLQVETETYDLKEGGVNDYVERLPGRTKVSNLVLKRGVTSSNELWKWFVKTMTGKIERQNVTVVLYSADGQRLAQWTFNEAYPVKWVGPAFKAGESGMAIETLELTHRGVQPS